MKLNNRQRQELWGETGPYSQLNLRIETRILDDRASRVFVYVEAEINPFTYKLIKKNRDKFTKDKILQDLLDSACYEGQEYGYVTCLYKEQLLAEENNFTGNNKIFEIAHKILDAVQETIIKMHKFVMDQIEEA